MPKYTRPTTLADALEAMAMPGAHVLVGGTDLLVGLRHHTVEPELIVDLKAVADLPEPIVVNDDGVRIGATLTLRALTAHPTVQKWYPGLVEAAQTVGSVAIRNRATLVGNSCNASPAADTVPSLLVHDACITIASPEGQRTLALVDFFLGPRRTLCSATEIVTRIDLPRPESGSGSAFRRLTRRRGVDIATINVAARITATNLVTLAFGAVGPTALRAEIPDPIDLHDEPQLNRLMDEHLRIATPISDIRGSREYRACTLRVLARRAVLAAAERRNDREQAS